MSKRDDDAQVPSEIPAGLDRRKFIMRSAVISAAAVMNGCSRSETEAKAPPPAAEGAPAAAAGKAPDVQLAPDLNVVKKGAGPVLTTVDEFYKVGPGPSSSHTIGPMRITYDFYQRASKLPADKLDKATALKVLMYDGQGFWLCHKRLSQGRFPWWPSATNGSERLAAHQLLVLLAAGNPTRTGAAPDWRPIGPLMIKGVRASSINTLSTSSTIAKWCLRCTISSGECTILSRR